MKKRTKKSGDYLMLFVAIALAVAALSFLIVKSPEGLSVPSDLSPPEKVVLDYFSAWNKKDYSKMYAQISDGFKKIDENAKTLNSFSDYAASQNIEGVKILSIKQSSNNGKTASVDYSVEFTLANGKKIPFSGTYTIKYRDKDRVRAWKMIHPYGENIDTT